jgi:hypothetical protein
MSCLLVEERTLLVLARLRLSYFVELTGFDFLH